MVVGLKCSRGRKWNLTYLPYTYRKLGRVGSRKKNYASTSHERQRHAIVMAWAQEKGCKKTPWAPAMRLERPCISPTRDCWPAMSRVYTKPKFHLATFHHCNKIWQQHSANLKVSLIKAYDHPFFLPASLCLDVGWNTASCVWWWTGSGELHCGTFLGDKF